MNKQSLSSSRLFFPVARPIRGLVDRFVGTQYFKSILCFIFCTIYFGSSRASPIQWSRRDVWCYFLLIELSWTQICEFMLHLEVRVLVFRCLLSHLKLHFIFLGFYWTLMAPRRELVAARAQDKCPTNAYQLEAR